MPNYEYRCIDCNHKFEIFLSYQEYGSTSVSCPACGQSHPKRIIKPVRVARSDGDHLESMVDQYTSYWHFYGNKEFDTMLYEVPHDSLIVLGAYGHGIIKEILLGSKMEHIQSTVTNNLLITGPNCTISLR